MPPLTEARRHPRHRICTLVSCRLDSANFLTQTLDLGWGGMRIEVPHPLQIDQRVDTQLVLDRESIRPKGRVVYYRQDPQGRAISGIQFVDISQRDRRLLEGFIARLESSPRTEGPVSGKLQNRTLGRDKDQIRFSEKSHRLPRGVKELTRSRADTDSVLVPEGATLGAGKQTEQYTEMRNALLRLFLEKLARKDYLEEVLKLIQKWSGCGYGGIRVLDGEGNIPYESYVGFSREFWERENWLSIEHDQCACVRAITGKTEPQDIPVLTPAGSFCCNNTVKFLETLSEDERARFRGVCIQSGFLSVAVIPLRHRENVVGAIHLTDKGPNKVPLELVESIEAFAPLIGEATHRFNLEEELRKSKDQLRELSSQLLSAHEDERKRVARELHDCIGSTLVAIKVGLQRKLDQAGNAPPPPGISLEDIMDLVQTVIGECRRIQMDLRPPMLDDIGLLATINWHCREFNKVTPQIRIEKRLDIQEDEVPEGLKIAIYRILQEALNNVAKHSAADSAHLSLEKSDKGIELSIEDNGRGVDLDKKLHGEPTGLGTASMKERAELSGGSLAIESVEGVGTAVRAFWPFPRDNETLLSKNQQVHGRGKCST